MALRSAKIDLYTKIDLYIYTYKEVVLLLHPHALRSAEIDLYTKIDLYMYTYKEVELSLHSHGSQIRRNRSIHQN